VALAIGRLSRNSAVDVAGIHDGDATALAGYLTDERIRLGDNAASELGPAGWM
jgi:hypothetical protein